MKKITALFLLTMVLGVFSSSVMAKPLKVYILAGQSNMQGHAKTTTFDYIGMDPKTAPILKEMRNSDGSPLVCEKVWISSVEGPKQGKLTAGYGASARGPKIGPEFTFGIYMQKIVNEPVLGELAERWNKVKSKSRSLSKDKSLTKAQRNAALDKFKAQTYTPEETALREKGASNAGYHYLGSAKILAQIGKAFAEAIAEMKYSKYH